MLLQEFEVHQVDTPAQGDTPAETFDNYDHEMLCLLQNLPMDNSTPEQTDISVVTVL